MMKRLLLNWRLLLFALTVTTVGAACSGSGDDENKPCSSSVDCTGEGERCSVEGKCTKAEQACTYNSECGSTNACVDGFCKSGICTEEEESKCGRGNICVDGLCASGCRSNDDCDATKSEICQEGLCRAGECTEGSCADYQVCDLSGSQSVCKFDGSCDCSDSLQTYPRGAGESEYAYCARVPSGDTTCGFYAQQEGKSGKWICSANTKRCVQQPDCAGENDDGDIDCGVGRICIAREEGGVTKTRCEIGCRPEKGCPGSLKCLPNPNPAFDWHTCQQGCETSSECEGYPLKGCVDAVCVDACERHSDCDNSGLKGYSCRPKFGSPDVKTCQGCRPSKVSEDCFAGHICDTTALPHEPGQPVLGLCVPRDACAADVYGENHLQESDPTDLAIETRAYEITLPFEGKGDKSPYFCRKYAATGGDFFKFKANQGEVIQITLEYDEKNTEANLDLSLLEVSSTKGTIKTLAASNRPPVVDQGMEEIRYGVAAPDQTFVIRVSGDLFNRGYIPYNLKVTTAPQGACTADPFETNNDFANASEIPEPGKDQWVEGLTVCGQDPDFYKFTAKKQQAVSVMLEHQSRLGEVSFKVYEENGVGGYDEVAVAEREDNADNNDKLFAYFKSDIAVDKTYYVEVKKTDDIGIADYKLSWVQSDNKCVDPLEGVAPDTNDDCSNSAAQISFAPGVKKEGLRVCLDGDFYCKNLKAGQEATFKACYDRLDVIGNLGISIRGGVNSCNDSFPHNRWERTVIGGTKECISVKTGVVSASATYCARVFMAQGIRADYSFEYEATAPPACTEDSLNNLTQATAHTFDYAQAKLGKDNFAGNAYICENTSDYYKINIPNETTETTLKFEVLYDKLLGELDVEIAKDDGTTLQTVAPGVAMAADGKSAEVVIPANTPAADYYLIVKGSPTDQIRNAYKVYLYVNGQTVPKKWCPDQFELNDNIANATELASDDTYDNLLTCRQGSLVDDDWYKFEVTAGQTVTVTVNWTGTGNMKTALFGGSVTSQKLLGQQYNNNKPHVLSYTSKKTQTLYLNIVTNSANTDVPYSIKLERSTAPACVSDRFDTASPANNTRTDAVDLGDETTVVNNLQLCEGSQDWFKFTAKKDKTVGIFLRYIKDQVAPTIEFFDSAGAAVNGVTLSSSSTYGQLYKLPVNTAADKTYYFKISAPDQARFHYALVIGADDTNYSDTQVIQCPDIFEKNPNTNTAAVVGTSLGTTETYENLLICNQNGNLFKAVAGDVDYYKVTLQPQMTATVKIKFSNATQNLDLSVFEGSTLVEESKTTTDDEEVTFANTTGAIKHYYIKVEKASGSTSNDDVYYTMEVTSSYTSVCVHTGNPGEMKYNTDAPVSSGSTSNSYYSDIQLCEGDSSQWLTLTSPTSTDIEVTLAYYDASTTLKLELINIDSSNAQNVVATATASSGSSRILKLSTTSAPTTGTNWLKVTPTPQGRTKYSLYFVSNPSNPKPDYCIDPYEYNNNELMASKIDIASTDGRFKSTEPLACMAEEDWYSFAASPGTGKFYIGALGELNQLSMELYEEGATTATNLLTGTSVAASKANGVEAVVNGLVAGKRYNLKVKHTNASAALPYNLLLGREGDLTSSSKCKADEFEGTGGNNGFYDATAISEFGKVHYATICKQDEDYYSVSVPAGEHLHFRVYTLSDNNLAPLIIRAQINSVNIQEAQTDGVATLDLDNSSGPAPKVFTINIAKSVSADAYFPYFFIID